LFLEQMLVIATFAGRRRQQRVAVGACFRDCGWLAIIAPWARCGFLRLTVLARVPARIGSAKSPPTMSNAAAGGITDQNADRVIGVSGLREAGPGSQSTAAPARSVRLVSHPILLFFFLLAAPNSVAAHRDRPLDADPRIRCRRRLAFWSAKNVRSVYDVRDLSWACQ